MTNTPVFLGLPMDASGVSAIATCAAVIVAICGFAFAFWQIHLLRRQLQYDALIKLIENNREITSLCMSDKTLWELTFMKRKPNNEHERMLRQKIGHMWINQFSLVYEAKRQGRFTKHKWQSSLKEVERTAENPGVIDHWDFAGYLYPSGFREWFDERIQKAKKRNLEVSATNPSKDNQRKPNSTDQSSSAST